MPLSTVNDGRLAIAPELEENTVVPVAAAIGFAISYRP